MCHVLFIKSISNVDDFFDSIYTYYYIYFNLVKYFYIMCEIYNFKILLFLFSDMMVFLSTSSWADFDDFNIIFDGLKWTWNSYNNNKNFFIKTFYYISTTNNDELGRYIDQRILLFLKIFLNCCE